MKKMRIFLPLLAFVFAVVAAFALPTKPDSSFKKDEPGMGCIDQTVCTATSGPLCDFTALDGSCEPSGHRKN